jgi:hypothetical protein
MRRTSSLATALLSIAVVLSACSGHGSTPGTGPADSTTHQQSAQRSPDGVPIALSTHCGIKEMRIGASYYLADHPLDDGNGNPPAGWANPFQQGTVTTPSPSVAIFRDSAGHVVSFHVRPGATNFLEICD